MLRIGGLQQLLDKFNISIQVFFKDIEVLICLNLIYKVNYLLQMRNKKKKSTISDRREHT
jgi:hypothetical protein